MAFGFGFCLFLYGVGFNSCTFLLSGSDSVRFLAKTGFWFSLFLLGSGYFQSLHKAFPFCRWSTVPNMVI